MELQALEVPMAPVDPRAHRGFWGASVSQAPWARRVSQGMLGTQDPQGPQEFRGPKVKLVKRGTQVHLGLLDPRARKVLLERMGPKGAWAPRGWLEI